MIDFILAALPWVFIGVSIAIAIVSLYQISARNKKSNDEASKENVVEVENDEIQEAQENSGELKEKKEADTNGLALGISMGLMIGTSFGLFFDNLAMGTSMGLLWGVVLGNLYDAKKKK